MDRKGYMIVFGRGVDASRMGAYAQAAVPLLLRYGGKLLTLTDEGKAELMEGTPMPDSLRVFEFPSLQSARDFYHSAEYTAAKQHRLGNGELDVYVMDGFVPDPKWTR